MSSNKYDIINAGGGIVSRGITSAAAATVLGVTEQEIIDGVTAASFLDGGGVRCTGYFNVWGDDYEYRWGAKKGSVDLTVRSPVIGAPELAEV